MKNEQLVVLYSGPHRFAAEDVTMMIILVLHEHVDCAEAIGIDCTTGHMTGLFIPYAILDTNTSAALRHKLYSEQSMTNTLLSYLEAKQSRSNGYELAFREELIANDGVVPFDLKKAPSGLKPLRDMSLQFRCSAADAAAEEEDAEKQLHQEQQLSGKRIPTDCSLSSTMPGTEEATHRHRKRKHSDSSRSKDSKSSDRRSKRFAKLTRANLAASAWARKDAAASQKDFVRRDHRVLLEQKLYSSPRAAAAAYSEYKNWTLCEVPPLQIDCSSSQHDADSAFSESVSMVDGPHDVWGQKNKSRKRKATSATSLTVRALVAASRTAGAVCRPLRLLRQQRGINKVVPYAAP